MIFRYSCRMIGITAFLILAYYMFTNKHDNANKIALILPIDHPAMHEIAKGLLASTSEVISNMDIKQAYGDAVLRRALIDQAVQEHYSAIATVGTIATQELLSTNYSGAIIALAANATKNDFCGKKGVIIHDEILAEDHLKYIQELLPSLRHLTLICSNSEKIAPEADEFQRISDAYQVKLKILKIAALPELSLVLTQIPNDIDGIFILKDLMIVDGLPVILDYCAIHHIPLFCSDEGSVRTGATCALGVEERSIGYEGGKEYQKFLSASTPVLEKTIEHKTFYVNANNVLDDISLDSFSTIAIKNGYHLNVINEALHD